MAQTMLKNIESLGVYHDLKHAVAINAVSNKKLGKHLRVAEKDTEIDESYKMVLQGILNNEKGLKSLGKGRDRENNDECFALMEMRPQRLESNIRQRSRGNNDDKCDVLEETRSLELHRKLRDRGDNNGDVLEETRPQILEPHNRETSRDDNNGEHNSLEVTRFGLMYQRRCRDNDCDCYILENFFQRIKSDCKRKDRDEMVGYNAQEEKDSHYERLVKVSKECGDAYGKSNALEWKEDGSCMALDVAPHSNEGITSSVDPSSKIRDNEEPGPSCTHNDSEFRRRLFQFLRRPYDEEEYVMHRNAAGLYFHCHPEIEEKLSKYRHKPGKCMTILRGFFFWLHNVKEEGVFEPWKDRECLAVEPLNL